MTTDHAAALAEALTSLAAFVAGVSAVAESRCLNQEAFAERAMQMVEQARLALAAYHASKDQPNG